MTLSDPGLLRRLRRDFVCGWRNINGVESFAGTSHYHGKDFAAAKTTIGAGHRNIQIFVMRPDGEILTCLPGYWDADALSDEIELAVALNRLRDDPKLSVAQKNERFMDAHLQHALNHSSQLRNDSRHQPFDRRDLEARESTDFRREPAFTTETLKRPDQVFHERMAERPFTTLENFDLAAFVDMGTRFYDAGNDGCCGHEPLRHGDPVVEPEVTPDPERGADREPTSSGERPTSRPTTRPAR